MADTPRQDTPRQDTPRYIPFDPPEAGQFSVTRMPVVVVKYERMVREKTGRHTRRKRSYRYVKRRREKTFTSFAAARAFIERLNTERVESVTIQLLPALASPRPVHWVPSRDV